MTGTRPEPGPATAAHGLELGVTLSRIAAELDHSARACTGIQWLISGLLERADHPDLAAELHMLQDIDRLEQTLFDLARLVGSLPGVAGPGAVPAQLFEECLRLVSLRHRILPDGTCGGDNDGGTDDEVTWL